MRNAEQVEQEARGQKRKEPEEEEQQQELTDTIKLGLVGMQSQEEAILRKIDEMMAVGTTFLDGLKEQFLLRMDNVKKELRALCSQQTLDWEQMSLETLEARQRLMNAQHLVQRLGLKAASENNDSDASEPSASL